MVAATTPVLALAGLLGGIVIEAIVTLTVITLALAVFCFRPRPRLLGAGDEDA